MPVSLKPLLREFFMMDTPANKAILGVSNLILTT